MITKNTETKSFDLQVFKQAKNPLELSFEQNEILKIKKEYLLKLNSDSTLLWMNFKENFLFQSIQNSNKYLFIDKFTINGVIGQKLFLSSTFSMYRHTGNQVWISNDYQG